jgi:hypothetical protein
MLKLRKTGSISIFFSIILSSLVIAMSVLTSASNIRCREHVVSSSMVNQQNLILSGYSEILLDRYGFYSTLLQDRYESEFYLMAEGFPKVTGYSIVGTEELSGSVLKKEIQDFSKYRVPVFVAFDILTRFTQWSEIIQSKIEVLSILEYKQNPDCFQSEDLTCEDSDKILDFNQILEILSILKEDIFFELNQNSKDPSFPEYDLTFLLEYFEKYDPKKSLDTPFQQNSLINIEAFLTQFSHIVDILHSFNTPTWYEWFAFHFYINKMFSCKTDYIIDHTGNQIFETDLKNREHRNIPETDSLELEKILFGFDRKEVNNVCTAVSVQSVRMLFHILANYVDEVKYSQIQTISIALCNLVSILSAGTVNIPVEIMEFVVIVMKSQIGSAVDYATMARGKGVDLLPMNSELNVATYYKDYLFLLLLFVPEEIKLNRMLSIMKENIGIGDQPLYTQISLSCRFRNSNYVICGSYHKCNYEQ